MSITLEVPEEIARAAQREAQQSGTPLESLLLKTLAAHFAPAVDDLQAELAAWNEATDEDMARFLEKQEVPYQKAAALSHPTLAEMQAKNAETIAYLQERMQNVITDPEENARAEAELAELHENLNRNRIEAGERPLFPE